MKTVLPWTREHRFQGFGDSRFGPFRPSLSNLCQRLPKTPKIRKTTKKHSQNGIVVRPRAILESPFGVLGFRWWFQNSFFMRPGAFEATKQYQNGAKTMKKTSNTMQ